jgi:hypothetical protein
MPKGRFLSTASAVVFTVSLILYGAVCAEVALGHLQPRGWAVVAAGYLVLFPAVILFLRSHRVTVLVDRFVLPPLVVTIGAFLLLALLGAWQTKDGITFNDESAYRFQARIFSAGRLWASPLPGAADSSGRLRAISFDHHILLPSRWFTKYPPGWPLLLALPERFHYGWLLNPLLGATLLWLIFQLGESVFDRDTAKLALVFAVLSPYFIVYTIGYMSHASCSVLVVGATLAMIRALRRQTALWVYTSFSLLVYACLTRPLTGIVSLCVIMAYGVRYSQPRLRRFIICVGIGAFALTVLLTLLYNRVYTGSYWLSPYALIKGVSTPKEISLNPISILRNIAFLTRWSLQNTLVYTFPFLFLLGAYAATNEWNRSPEVRLLAVFFPTLVVAHFVQTERSASFLGERYYFEGFFAVVLLAARGFTLFVKKWNPSKTALAGLTAGFLLLQIGHITLAGIVIKRHSDAYSRAVALVRRLPGEPYVVFFAGRNDSSSRFVPKQFNCNGVNWEKESLVFLVDPGVEQRDMWARRLGRRKWVVVAPSQDNNVRIGQLGTVGEGSAQSITRVDAGFHY